MSILENEYFGDNSVNFKIYPIQYLFYTLKMSTAEKGEVKKPESIFISDAIFERDTFEYQNKISCDVSFALLGIKRWTLLMNYDFSSSMKISMLGNIVHFHVLLAGVTCFPTTCA